MTARSSLALLGASVLACALVCCDGGVPDLGFAIAVQIEFDDATITSAKLANVTSLEIRATGDEQFTQMLTPDRTFQRVERFVYYPMATTRTLSLAVDALDGTGALVGQGRSATLALSAGRTDEITIIVAGSNSVCGATGEACCGGGTCNTTLGCQKDTSICTTCGNSGEPCCVNDTCTAAGTACHGGTCK